MIQAILLSAIVVWGIYGIDSYVSSINRLPILNLKKFSVKSSQYRTLLENQPVNYRIQSFQRRNVNFVVKSSLRSIFQSFLETFFNRKGLLKLAIATITFSVLYWVRNVLRTRQKPKTREIPESTSLPIPTNIRNETKVAKIEKEEIEFLEIPSVTPKVYSYFNETYIRASRVTKSAVNPPRNQQVESVKEKKVVFDQLLQRAKQPKPLQPLWTPNVMIRPPNSSVILSASHASNSTTYLTESDPEENAKIIPFEDEGTLINDVILQEEIIEADEIVEEEGEGEIFEGKDEITFESVHSTSDTSALLEEQITESESVAADSDQISVVSEVVDAEVLAAEKADAALMSLQISRKLKNSEIAEDIGAASALLAGLVISVALGPTVGLALAATSGLIKKRADAVVPGGSKRVIESLGVAVIETAKLVNTVTETVTTALDEGEASGEDVPVLLPSSTERSLYSDLDSTA